MQDAVEHALVGDPHGVRIVEGRPPVDEVDAVALDVLVHDLAQGPHDLLLAVHEVLHREVWT